MFNFLQNLQFHVQEIIYIIFFVCSICVTEQSVQIFFEKITGILKPKPVVAKQSAPVAPVDPRSDDQKKKDKEAADKKKEEDFKKIKNYLWIASSIAGAVIMTWVLIKHLTE